MTFSYLNNLKYIILKSKQARKGFRPVSAIKIFTGSWKHLGNFWEFFGNFGGNSFGILLEFFENSLEILWKFFGNSLRFFGNSIRIVWELFGNSLGILWNFFGISLELFWKISKNLSLSI